MNIIVVNSREENMLEKQVFHFVHSCVFAFLKTMYITLH